MSFDSPFERHLSPAEISAAKKKGKLKAAEIFKVAGLKYNPESYLKEQYDAVIGCLSPLLDNFDPANFRARGHHEAEDQSIRPLLLSAYKALECLKKLEDNPVIKSSLFSDEVYEWYENRLQIAAFTYRMNGRLDVLPFQKLKLAA